jgi:hypothetical protein
VLAVGAAAWTWLREVDLFQHPGLSEWPIGCRQTLERFPDLGGHPPQITTRLAIRGLQHAKSKSGLATVRSREREGLGQRLHDSHAAERLVLDLTNSTGTRRKSASSGKLAAYRSRIRGPADVAGGPSRTAPTGHVPSLPKLTESRRRLSSLWTARKLYHESADPTSPKLFRTSFLDCWYSTGATAAARAKWALLGRADRRRDHLLDSMTLYREMDIGTDRLTRQQRRGVSSPLDVLSRRSSACPAT